MNRQFINHALIKIFLLCSFALLSACATREPLPEAARLAARQAALIRQHLPMASGTYTWIQAQSKGTVIYITLINKNASTTKLSEEEFKQIFLNKMCEQPGVRALQEKGVTYQITVDTLQPFILNAQTCSAVHS